MILKQRPQMKRVVLLVILVNVIVASALECQPSSVYGRSLEEMSDPTYILNFDDQEWTNAVHTTLDVPLVLEAYGFTFTISGESCQIQSEATMFDESTTWDGNNLWDGLDVGSVGYFLTATTNTSSCTIEFSPPISEIFLFAMCGATDSCIISVYDSDDTQLNCGRVVNSPGYNTHWNWGMTGYKQIAKLVFTGGKGAIDEIIVRQGCGAGSWWNQGQCEVFDACSLGYCDYYANCTSFGSDVMSPMCTCAVGYFGDGFFCQNVNECEPESGVSPCPNNTLCDDNYGSFSCYCDPSIFEYDIGSVDLVCEDINECDSVVCVPEAMCHNFYGGYECRCPEGFVGDGSAFTGVGCTFTAVYMCLNESACHPFATCGSDDGVTLNCTCPEGFPGDGIGPDGCGPMTSPIACDTPQSDAPESDTPQSDTPQSDAPESDTPESNTPQTNVPESNTPQSDSPQSDAPESNVPKSSTSPQSDTAPSNSPRGVVSMAVGTAPVNLVMFVVSALVLWYCL